MVLPIGRRSGSRRRSGTGGPGQGLGAPGALRGQREVLHRLYSITGNHCFNKLKSSAWRGEQGTEPETLEAFADLGPNPERAAETSERLALARRLMASELTEVERQVMTLHFAEDMPFEVISRLLRLDNASGAKAYVVSAKRKLRSSVQRWMGRTRGANAHEGGGDGG